MQTELCSYASVDSWKWFDIWTAAECHLWKLNLGGGSGHSGSKYIFLRCVVAPYDTSEWRLSLVVWQHHLEISMVLCSHMLSFPIMLLFVSCSTWQNPVPIVAACSLALWLAFIPSLPLTQWWFFLTCCFVKCRNFGRNNSYQKLKLGNCNFSYCSHSSFPLKYSICSSSS